MPSTETGGSYPEGPDRCWGRAGYQSAGGEQLHCASLVFIVFFSYFPSSFIFSPHVISLIIIIGGSSSRLILYLSYWIVLISAHGIYILLILLPIPPGAGGRKKEGASKWLHGSELPSGLKP